MILRAALGRFLPACASIFSVFGLGVWLTDPVLAFGLLHVLLLIGMVTGLTAGFALGLWGMAWARRGRRTQRLSGGSLAAGIFAPGLFLLASVFFQGAGWVGIAVITVLIGAGLGVMVSMLPLEAAARRAAHGD